MTVPDPLDCFVNRAEATEKLLDMARKSTELEIVDLKGVQGSGKSLLLERIEDKLAKDTDVAVVRLSMGAYDITDGHATDEAAIRRHASHDKYRQLLDALAKRLDAEAFEPLVAATAPPGGENASHAELDTLDAARHEEMTRTFLSCASTFATKRRAVILLDDFERVLGQDVAFWLLTDVVANLSNALVVIARIMSLRGLPGRPAVVPIDLGNLDRSHVVAYLHYRLGRIEAVDDLADAIFGFSSGHPEAVSLAADLIDQRGLHDRVSVVAFFNSLSSDPQRIVHELVEKIIAGVEDPDVAAALRLCWVARRLDAGLLRALLRDRVSGDGDRDRFGRLMAALTEYSFTEQCRDVQATDTPAWRFHDLSVRSATRSCARATRSLYEELHRRCAAYFSDRLRQADEAIPSETSYARALRHDSSAWQALAREWLYHLAHLSNRQEAGVALARMYLNAFYWWGWYEPYSLCDQVLEDWERTQHTPEDLDWRDDLRAFRGAYPTVWDRQTPNWDDVQGLMEDLRELGGLNIDGSALSKDQRRLRVLIDTFLAQSHLRRDEPDPSGEEFYRDARALLEDAPEDQWLRPWIAFWLGQSALERNDLKTASDECERTMTWGREEVDYEALAAAWQFRGDINWRTGDLAAAVWGYVMSVGYAFELLANQPDQYCKLFFDEMSNGAVRRIRALWSNGRREAAIQACVTVRQFYSPLAERLGSALGSPEFPDLLDNGHDDDLRTILLLELPGEEILERRIAIRAAARFLRRQLDELERTGPAEWPIAQAQGGPLQAGPLPGRPSRLRWGLAPAEKRQPRESAR